MEISRIVLLFFVYSLIGWLWETVYCSLKAKKFVYRGFLLGPYCPIYGFGVLSVLYFVEPYQNNLIVLYLLSAVTVSVLEYLTSYVLERLFKTTWWDYHEVPLNINGRVAVPISLFWGAGCVLIVKVVQPQVSLLVSFLLQKFGDGIALFLFLLILVDSIYTVVSMVSLRKVLSTWSNLVEATKNELETKKNELLEDIEQHKANVREYPEGWLGRFQSKREELAKLPHLSFNHRRVLDSFSQLKVKDIPNLVDLKLALRTVREKKEK